MPCTKEYKRLMDQIRDKNPKYGLERRKKMVKDILYYNKMKRKGKKKMKY